MARLRPGQTVYFHGRKGVIEALDLTPGMADVRYGTLVKRHKKADLSLRARRNSSGAGFEVYEDPPTLTRPNSWGEVEVCGNPIDGTMYVLTLPSKARAVGQLVTETSRVQTAAGKVELAKVLRLAQEAKRVPLSTAAEMRAFLDKDTLGLYSRGWRASIVYRGRTPDLQEDTLNPRFFSAQDVAAIQAGKGLGKDIEARGRKTAKGKPTGYSAAAALPPDTAFFRDADANGFYAIRLYTRTSPDIEHLFRSFQPPWAKRSVKRRNPYFSWVYLNRDFVVGQKGQKFLRRPVCHSRETLRQMRAARKLGGWVRRMARSVKQLREKAQEPGLRPDQIERNYTRNMETLARGLQIFMRLRIGDADLPKGFPIPKAQLKLLERRLTGTRPPLVVEAAAEEAAIRRAKAVSFTGISGDVKAGVLRHSGMTKHLAFESYVQAVLAKAKLPATREMVQPEAEPEHLVNDRRVLLFAYQVLGGESTIRQLEDLAQLLQDFGKEGRVPSKKLLQAAAREREEEAQPLRRQRPLVRAQDKNFLPLLDAMMASRWSGDVSYKGQSGVSLSFAPGPPGKAVVTDLGGPAHLKGMKRGSRGTVSLSQFDWVRPHLRSKAAPGKKVPELQVFLRESPELRSIYEAMFPAQIRKEQKAAYGRRRRKAATVQPSQEEGFTKFYTFNPALFEITRTFWDKGAPWGRSAEARALLASVDVVGRYGHGLKLLYEAGKEVKPADDSAYADTMENLQAILGQRLDLDVLFDPREGLAALMELQDMAGRGVTGAELKEKADYVASILLDLIRDAEALEPGRGGRHTFYRAEETEKGVKQSGWAYQLLQLFHKGTAGLDQTPELDIAAQRFVEDPLGFLSGLKQQSAEALTRLPTRTAKLKPSSETGARPVRQVGPSSRPRPAPPTPALDKGIEKRTKRASLKPRRAPQHRVEDEGIQTLSLFPASSAVGEKERAAAKTSSLLELIEKRERELKE